MSAKIGQGYIHNGRNIFHGSYTESGNYQTCRVDGKWYYHPADTDWLAFNGNWEFSQAYETEAEALEAAENWEANN